MFIAKDENGNLVEIDEVRPNKKYFCPCCGAELVVKRGDIRVHHFSHRSLSDCDSFYEPMTKWHLDWQRRFPKQCREVVVRNNGEIHRADVLLRNLKLVIEFQHSPISTTEILKRNRFYKEAGYKIIWIFDKQEVGDYSDILDCFSTVESGSRSKIALMMRYTDTIVYDYELFCNVITDLQECYGDDKLEYYGTENLLCKHEWFYDLLQNTKTHGGMKNVIESAYKSDKYLLYLRSLLERYTNNTYRNSKSISKLFSMLGEYVVQNIKDGKYLNAYWKNEHFKDNRYTTAYLANAKSSRNNAQMCNLCDSIKYDRGSYRVIKVDMERVLNEIDRRYT